MKKLLLTLLLCAPLCGLADTVNISGANRWSRIDSHTIIVYRGTKAICLVKTWGFIYSSSEIRFADDVISSYDKMIIDGDVEDIREVKRL
jgi:hypothetical protein